MKYKPPTPINSVQVPIELIDQLWKISGRDLKILLLFTAYGEFLTLKVIKSKSGIGINNISESLKLLHKRGFITWTSVRHVRLGIILNTFPEADLPDPECQAEFESYIDNNVELYMGERKR